MANEKLIIPIEKRYLRKTVGGVIQYLLDGKFKGMAIPVSTIIEIVCVITQDGECTFYKVVYGAINRRNEIIIDKDQYDVIIANQ